MTLQASRPISIGNVATELGIALPMNLGNATARLLAGIPSGNIGLGNFLGKTRYNFSAANEGAGVVGYSNAAGGGPFGSINNSAFNGVTIDGVFTQSGNLVGVRLSGVRAQNFFTSFYSVLHATLFLTASAASFSTATGDSIWKWGDGGTVFVVGNNYNFYLN